jgi:hypothetical protein
VTGYGLSDSGSIPDRGGGFLYPLRPAGSGALEASSTMCTEGSFAGG